MTWRLARALEQLRSQVNEKWPNRSKNSDGSIGDTSHAARPSDHNPDRAEIVHANRKPCPVISSLENPSRRSAALTVFSLMQRFGERFEGNRKRPLPEILRSRYDYTAWGEPIRNNGFAADGRWFGLTPETSLLERANDGSKLGTRYSPFDVHKRPSIAGA